MARSRAWLAAVSLVVAMMAPGVGVAQVLVVDGEGITAEEIDQHSKFDELAGHQTLSRDQVIDELRRETLALHEARRRPGEIDLSDAMVARVYANMAARMHLTSEQLTLALARRGIAPATLERRIRADLARQQLLRLGRPGAQAQTAPTQPSAPVQVPTLAPDSPGAQIDPTPEQQKCRQELAGYRTETETRAKTAAAESRKRPTRARMCDLVSEYATAELAWLEFAEANMARCGLSQPQVDQIRTTHGHTVDIKKRMCASLPPVKDPRWCADCPRSGDGGGLAAQPVAERAEPDAEHHDPDVSDAMVDAAIAAMARRMNMTPAQLDAALLYAGYDPTALRDGVRAEIELRRQGARLPPQE